MADHYWATLKIGGRVTAEQLREIVRLAVQDGAEQVECPPALQHLLREQRGLEVVARPQRAVLAVTGEVNWGAFEALEAYLRSVPIPYDRETEAAPDEPAILVRFRPGRGAVIHPSDGKGNRYLKHSHLFQAADPRGSAVPVLPSDEPTPASRFLRDCLRSRSYIPSTGV